MGRGAAGGAYNSGEWMNADACATALAVAADEPLDEAAALLVFERYADGDGTNGSNGAKDELSWSREALRMFLADLGRARCAAGLVPDVCLDAALRELQLDPEAPGRLSFMEFKSFFVYLMQAPLRHLFTVASRPLLQNVYEHLQSQVLAMQIDCSNGSPNESALREALERITSSPVKVYRAQHESNPLCIEYLIYVESPLHAETLIARTSSLLVGVAIISLHRPLNEDGSAFFPSWISPAARIQGKSKINGSPKVELPAWLVGGMATTMLWGKKLTNEINRIDREAGISRAVDRAAKNAGDAIRRSDEELGISRAVKTTATDLDRKTQLSARTKEFMANDNIRSALGAVSSFFGRVKGTANDIVHQAEEKMHQQEDTLQDAQTGQLPPILSGDVDPTAPNPYLLNADDDPGDL